MRLLNRRAKSAQDTTPYRPIFVAQPIPTALWEGRVFIDVLGLVNLLDISGYGKLAHDLAEQVPEFMAAHEARQKKTSISIKEELADLPAREAAAAYAQKARDEKRVY